MPWLTPDSIPPNTIPGSLSIPDGSDWRAAVRGALYELCLESNWEQHGTLTPAETATRYWEMFEEFIMGFDVVGSIVMWPTNTAPSKWLICDGSAIDRATYADLFALIGTSYGAGNGTTTFNLPDLRAKFPVGRHASNARFDTLAETGGQESVSHTHTLNNGTTRTSRLLQAGELLWNNSNNTANIRPYAASGGAATVFEVVKTMDSQPVETLPPYLTLNFIIRATPS